MLPTFTPLDTTAVENFREYLRIQSVQPNVNYDECVNFLKKQAASIGLEFHVHRDVPKNPVVIISWIGEEPSLRTIMLNNHMDVVPVFEDKWIHKPFDAVMDEEGNIYGRGAQDTKYLGIEYLEAIRRLKLNGFQPRRTVHVTFLPDEEAAGSNGMRKFVKSNYFDKLSVGFALDEGANLIDTFFVSYDEKVMWGFEIHCKGVPGHGSLLLQNTAGEKVHYLLNKLYKYRATQKAIQEKDPLLAKSTSINVTVLQGGVLSNVLPNELIIKVDTRVPSTDFKNFTELVERWCKEAGDDIWIEDIARGDPVPPTKIDETNPYWMAFKSYFEKRNLKLQPVILPGTSDARFLRSAGIPTIGFSPTQNTPMRFHDNNEFLNVNEFLKGIKMFTEILPLLTDV